MNAPRRNIGGIVLCGGDSRRMGSPKAWLQCGDEFLLQRIARIVSSVVGPAVAAGKADQDLPPLPSNIRIVQDAPDIAGPLAGIASGMDALSDQCEAVFVIACDHPLIRPQFIERQIELLDQHRAVVPILDGRIHPTTATYHLKTQGILKEMLQAGMRRATVFAERCEPRLLPPKDFAGCDPQLDSLRNFNDPESFSQLIESLTNNK